MVLIQESKLQEVNSRTMRFFLGKGSYQGEWVGSIGVARGLISLWDEKNFKVESKVVNQRYILLEGVSYKGILNVDLGIYMLLTMRERERGKHFGKNWELS